MKTSELAGIALDWAVAKCEGINVQTRSGSTAKEILDGKPPKLFLRLDEQCDVQGRIYDTYFSPSTDWSQGGSIIEREWISIVRYDDDYGKGLHNSQRIPTWYAEKGTEFMVYGHTPLVAAMRCYVLSKLGDKASVPKGFL